MKLLILGGTGDAKQLALALVNLGVTVVYSIAGIVRQPDLPCDVISGGFTPHGGLARYIHQHDITALLDATHPFAETMSQTAVLAAEQTGIPLWRYQRSAWQAQADDQWTSFQDWSQLHRHLHSYHSIFLSQGQLSESMLAALLMHRKPTQTFVHRTAIQPKHRHYDWMQWVQSIGPFSLEDELALLAKYQIEVIVSKNSGGALPAKLIAARQLGLPVLLLDMPKPFTNAAKPSATTNSYVDIPSLVRAISQSGNHTYNSISKLDPTA